MNLQFLRFNLKAMNLEYIVYIYIIYTIYEEIVIHIC